MINQLKDNFEKNKIRNSLSFFFLEEEIERYERRIEDNLRKKGKIL